MAGIPRDQLLKELLPGLNELFGLDYAKYTSMGKYRFCVRKVSDPESGWQVVTKVPVAKELDAEDYRYRSSRFYKEIEDMPDAIAEALALVLIVDEGEHLEKVGIKLRDSEFHVCYGGGGAWREV